MAIKETRGLVISEKDFKDQDKIITVFSEDGKFNAVVNGARLPKNRLAAGSRLFSWTEFSYFPSKKLSRITEAKLIEPFLNIGEDFEKMCLASFSAEILNKFFDEQQKDNGALKLAVYYYYYLSHTDISPMLLTLSFLIKLIELSGFSPDYSYLRKNVQKDGSTYFLVEEGIFTDSFKKNQYQYKLDKFDQKLLLYLFKEPFNRVKRIKVDNKKNSVFRLIKILVHFIETQQKIRIKSFNILKEIYPE